MIFTGAVTIHYFETMKDIQIHLYLSFIQTGALIAEMKEIDKQLLTAAQEGRDDDVRSCLANGADVHLTDYYRVRFAIII